MSDDLTARVQRLEDIESARGMFHTYAQILDEPNADAVAALFTDDGVLTVPFGTFTGRAEIRKFFADAFAADTSLKRHFIVNPRVVDVSNRTVTLASYLLYVGRGDDASIIGWGEYVDRIDVSGPEPRFASKTIDIHHATDLATGWARG